MKTWPNIGWLLYAISIQISAAQSLTWHTIPPKSEASFRGLSVVDDHSAWVSGSKGTVGRSVNGGRLWTFFSPAGYEKLDFRSVYGFDSTEALIGNAGSPAYLLRTYDGDRSWQKVYSNPDSSAFLDGIDFWDDQNGIAFGDPILGKMLILLTHDGGKTWEELPVNKRPALQSGEASFAASGTTIRCTGKSDVWIATGGKVSRLWHSTDRGHTWQPHALPILQGGSGTGVFSFYISDHGRFILVGGDYERDSLCKDHVFYSTNQGRNWQAPITPTRGYRECVELVAPEKVLAVGPGGADYSIDGGKSWHPESNEKGFHVVRKARKGNCVLTAGARGKIAVLKN